MVNPKLPVIWYGGDYYPEQWDEETFERDIRMFKEAGINVVTLGVFSWSLIQPGENTYDFSFFEKVMDRMYKEGIYVCLATPTSAPPHWMTQKYPEILLTDVNGVKREKGGRQNFCPNSEKYRYFARNIAEKLAEHFKDHPALVLWHVNNEYLNYCYCDICRGKFQNWLKEKYGTLDELNRRWNTRFWSQTFTAWEEIPVPTTRSVLVWRKDRYQSVLPELYLDYRRFMTQSMLECFLEEYRAIKKHTPDIPVTTNLIAATFKEWNYFEWAKHMDVAAWDNYPGYKEDFSVISLRHSLIRGLKEGKPFVLMEQSPSQACWRWYNPQKRPGEMRLWSYHALAHGAETLMFFQLRQSKGGVEKFHGAVITHVDSSNTRVFQEVKRVGEEIKSLSDILDTRVVSQTALLFDWESWWAMEDTLTPNIDFKYLNEAEKYFKALVKTGLGVDVVGKDQNFERYRVIVAPVLYMVGEELAQKLKDYVSSGGILILTTMSGIVDEYNQVVLGGYPGYLRDLMGGYVEEIDALPPEEKNEILMFGKRYECSLVFDYIKTTTAEVLGRFGKDYYMNEPAVLRNSYGKGWVYYIGSSASFDLVWDLVKFIEREHGLRAEIAPPDGVEVIKKVKGEKTFYFLFNHSHELQIVDLPEGMFKDLIEGNLYEKKARLQPLEVLILLKE